MEMLCDLLFRHSSGQDAENVKLMNASKGNSNPSMINLNMRSFFQISHFLMVGTFLDLPDSRTGLLNRLH